MNHYRYHNLPYLALESSGHHGHRRHVRRRGRRGHHVQNGRRGHHDRLLPLQCRILCLTALQSRNRPLPELQALHDQLVCRRGHRARHGHRVHRVHRVHHGHRGHHRPFPSFLQVQLH